jgi:hypothetical protein
VIYILAPHNCPLWKAISKSPQDQISKAKYI